MPGNYFQYVHSFLGFLAVLGVVVALFDWS